MSGEENGDLWELSPETAHPHAARILTDEFFWDCADENSPFGNDTGADALEFFREWRAQHARSNPSEFLAKVLADVFGVPDANPDALESEAAQPDEPEEDASVRDDASIAVAFGQLVLEGRVEAELKRRALFALRRQARPDVIGRRGWVSPPERSERLRRMREVLDEL